MLVSQIIDDKFVNFPGCVEFPSANVWATVQASSL